MGLRALGRCELVGWWLLAWLLVLLVLAVGLWLWLLVEACVLSRGSLLVCWVMLLVVLVTGLVCCFCEAVVGSACCVCVRFLGGISWWASLCWGCP
jgi:hypothetical protein